MAICLAVPIVRRSYCGEPRLCFVWLAELNSGVLRLRRSFPSNPPWRTSVSWIFCNSGTCSNSKLEGIQIDQSDKDVPVSSHEAVESKSETVEALLAELHDLSFMLADKIVNTNVKTETLE
eukprot:c19990_g1_i1 orf=179-541(+)